MVEEVRVGEQEGSQMTLLGEGQGGGRFEGVFVFGCVSQPVGFKKKKMTFLERHYSSS